MKANYKIELVTDTVILITDLDQYGQVSVTNDAINVIRELQNVGVFEIVCRKYFTS